ncbi:MAG: CRISPR system precrRNA processing endoribonuclease RAMP protein Cas6 [Caldilineaceae bacterium]
MTEVRCDTKLHPWSGRTTYDAMAYYHLYGQRMPLDHVTLNFHSPTACTDRTMIHAVPLLNLVFGNLLERWNEFAEVTLEPAVVQFAKNHMAISSFQLHTQSIYQVGNKQRTGCVGQVTYKALHGDSYQRALIQLLADFAFYGGVGMETTFGMGQVYRASIHR